MPRSTLVNRNIVAARGRTSMRLEPELWEALSEICRRERTSPSELCRRIERAGIPGGRTSAMRVYILRYFRTAATEAGHEAAGHGTKPGSAAATYFAEPGLHSLAAAPDA